MVTISLLTVSSLALCLAPAVAFFTRARSAAADAGAYGWDLPQAPAVGLWYGVALTAVGTLATALLYWPLTILYVLAGSVAVGLSRRLVLPVASSHSIVIPITLPALPTAEELARRRHDRGLSVVAAGLALLLGGLFAFTAAVSARDLAAPHSVDRSASAVAAALIESTSLNSALFGVAPGGSPQAGTQVAIVKTAPNGSDEIDYRIMTRAPEGGAWSSLEGVPTYATASDAIAAMTERYGIEKFTLWLADTGEGEGPPSPGPAP